MEASEFRQRVKEAMDLLQDNDGESANTGVAFFISDMQELIEEWEAEDHPCSM